MQIYIKNSNKDVLQKMQSAGFNVSTCGMCGEVVLYFIGKLEELTCECCGFTDDPSQFPDLESVEMELVK